MTRYLVVLTTLASEEQAVGLARELLALRLVACVNVVPGVRSLYRFKGVLEDDRECLLVMKTEAGRYGDLESAIRRLHPYEVPEVLALSVEKGSESYLAWVSQCVSETPDRSG